MSVSLSLPLVKIETVAFAKLLAVSSPNTSPIVSAVRDTCVLYSDWMAAVKVERV